VVKPTSISESVEAAGVSHRSLFSHKIGERFVYNGGLFTRIVLSDTFCLSLELSGVDSTSIALMRGMFLAIDQFGIINIFSREEQVVSIKSFPDFGNYYRILPDGVIDAEAILCKKHYQSEVSNASSVSERSDYLSNISGLRVTSRLEKGENLYEFYNGERCVKTCFTYPKAKLFAEGVQYSKDNPSPLSAESVSDKGKQDLIERCHDIGQFYLRRHNGDYAKACSDIELLRITDIELGVGEITITLCRPGLLIGVKGSTIRQLEEFLCCKIKIKEETFDLLHHLCPYDYSDY